MKAALDHPTADRLMPAMWRWIRWFYPDLPEVVVLQMLSGLGQEFSGEELPFNRHKRRRLKKAKKVVIHLFSGDHRWYLPGNVGEVMEVEKKRGRC